MIDDTSIYGSAVIFAVYFTLAWSIVGINSVSFLISFVIVCAWLMTQNLHGRLTSVGLAQARPNNTPSHPIVEHNYHPC